MDDTQIGQNPSKMEELSLKLDKLDKKLDKLLNLNTKIAKALHLLPVTEKEERALQIQQRTNLETAAKINSELNAMENKSDTNSENPLSFDNISELYKDVYADVLGDDIL